MYIRGKVNNANWSEWKLIPKEVNVDIVNKNTSAVCANIGNYFNLPANSSIQIPTGNFTCGFLFIILGGNGSAIVVFSTTQSIMHSSLLTTEVFTINDNKIMKNQTALLTLTRTNASTITVTNNTNYGCEIREIACQI